MRPIVFTLLWAGLANSSFETDIFTITEIALSTTVSALATDSPSNETPSTYISTSLHHHNIHRQNHSSPDVIWDIILAEYAATLASSCLYGHNLSYGVGGYGQNIAAFGETGNVQTLSPSRMVANAITDMWYNNELLAFLPIYYGQDTPDMSNFEAWGHFSQIVWNKSTGIGCATQYCGAGTIFSMASWYTVCNYIPNGNIEGEYGSNIGIPLGQPTITSPVYS